MKLLPREHGAYGQLGAPLAAALLMERPTVAGGLLAVAAIAAFAAQEPLRVRLGHRGGRARVELGRAAMIALPILAAVSLGAGAGGLVLAGAHTALAAIPVALVAAVAFALVLARRAHTLGGELVAVAALAGAAVPVAVAAGVSWRVAGLAWLGWTIGFAATVIAVHRVIARHKRPRTRADTLALGVLALVTLTAPLVGLWHAAVLAAPSAALVARPPSATRLRTIGVALVGFALLAVVVAIRA